MARRPPSGRRRRSRLTPRRWLPLVALVAVAVLAIVALPDPIRHDAEQERADRAAALVPSGASDGAISSAWFCGGGSSMGGKGPAELVLVIANVAPQRAKATVTVVNDDGDRAARSVSVPAHGSRRVPTRSIRSGTWVAATVEVLGGAPVVSREVSGPDGIDASPCASSASDVWHVASGTTVRGATEVLSIYNPFPDSATVDVAFATDSGPRQPRALKGLSVPGGSLRVVQVNETVTNRTRVAATVRARFGRVVVDRVQRYDGTGEAPPDRSGDPTGSEASDPTPTAPPDGEVEPTAPEVSAPDGSTPDAAPGDGTAPVEGSTPEAPATLQNLTSGDAPAADPEPAVGPVGLVSTPATPGTAARWLFPGTDPSDASAGQVAVYNPGDEPAEVDVVLTYEEPGRNPPVEPIQLTVAPRQQVIADLAETGGLEAEVAFTVDVRSLQGVGVVVELLDTAVSPQPVIGAAVAQGAPIAASRWLVAGVSANAALVTSVIVANPGRKPARIVVTENHDGGRRRLGGAPVVIPAGDRRTLDVSTAASGSILSIEARSPVVVTTGLDAIAGVGRSTALAQPAPATVGGLPAPS